MKKVFCLGNDAFVDIGSGYLLRIGSAEEVKKSTPEEVDDMVKGAIAVALLMGISVERRK